MINIGIIGAGQWGKNHVRVWHDLPNANMASIADKNRRVLADLERRYSVKGSQDYKEILENPDITAVDVCTPNDTHYKIVKGAFEAGKDVMVEKPLTLKLKNARKLIELSKETKKVLMVGHVFRFNPAVRYLKDSINAGMFGKLHFLCADRIGLYPPKKDSGVVIDLGIHDVDIFQFLMESMPVSVTATGGSYLRKQFEETAFIDLCYENGVVAHANISWLIPKKVRAVWVAGEKKSAYVDYASQEAEIFSKGIEREYDSFGKFTLIQREGDTYKPYIKTEEPLRVELLHFIDCVENRKTPIASGEVAYDVLSIIKATHDSMKKKKTIFLK